LLMGRRCMDRFKRDGLNNNDRNTSFVGERMRQAEARK
jgi:hypothetical protein